MENDKFYTLKAQIILYALVGVLCSTVDILLFYVLYLMSSNLIICSITSFTVATGVNYLLCRRFVFMSGRFEVPSEIFRLFVVSAVGLILNTLFVYVLTQYFMLSPVFSKMLAIPLVFSWNFISRKFFVFHKYLPLK